MKKEHNWFSNPAVLVNLYKNLKKDKLNVNVFKLDFFSDNKIYKRVILNKNILDDVLYFLITSSHSRNPTPSENLEVNEISGNFDVFLKMFCNKCIKHLFVIALLRNYKLWIILPYMKKKSNKYILIQINILDTIMFFICCNFINDISIYNYLSILNMH